MRSFSLAVLVVMSWLDPIRADEPRTFCGNTVDGWIRIVREKTSSQQDRLRAIWALGCFGPEARAAGPCLIDEVRQGPFKDEAIDALIGIGAGTELTVPFWMDRFLKQGCLHLTGAGTFAGFGWPEAQLARIGGPAVPPLLDVLKGRDQAMRVCAAEALGEVGPPARAAVPSLIDAIQHPDAGREADILTRYAIQALGRIGPEARAAVPILDGLLDKGKFHIEVGLALAGIGVSPVRKLVTNFIREGDSFGGYKLTWFGPEAREAAPSLRNALTDKRPQVRISAAVALAHIEPAASEAIPVLIDALSHFTDGDEELDLSYVADALARFGPRAKAAMPILVGYVNRGIPDPDFTRALVQIDPEGRECLPALVSALKHEDSDVVDAAARSLGLLGSRAKDAVPALTVAVTRDFHERFYNNHDPQLSAAKALRRIGPEARSAIPALIAALKYRHVVPTGFGGCDGGFGPEEMERDSTAAAAAAEVLGSFGVAAKAAVPALIEAVQTREKDDASWPLRHAAMLALGQLGPEAKAAVPMLRELMTETDRDSQVTPELIVALYQLAPDGKELAEEWLAKPIRGRMRSNFELGLENQALVLGAMGRASFETDWLTRDRLERMDSTIAHSDPRDAGREEFLEERFEKFGTFRSAGRLAIPRLTEYREDADPWVRMSATEALEQIKPPLPR